MFHFHRDKDRYGFTHRLTKVAEVGAVVGGLLYLGHHFSEGIGGALSSFAESEDRKVFDETTIAAANGLTKGVSTFESMMDEKFGDSELNKGISLIHDITTGMRTDVLQQKRATSFLSRLGKFTDTPDAIQNLKPHDYQEVLQGVIKSGRISNEANINEAIEFSSHDTVNEITKLLGSKGVTLNQDFLQDSTTKMREILRETRKVALTAKEQRSFSSGNNVKMITQALEHMQGVSRYNAKALDKFAGVDKAMKELDLKGLFQAVVDSENGHKELADKLDDYFNKSKYKVLTDFVNPNGTLHEHAHLKSFLKDTTDKYLSSNIFKSARLNKLNYADLLKRNDPVAKVLLGSKTGIAISNKTGNIVTKSFASKKALDNLRAIGRDFQVPFIPFKFNTPLKAFNFMPKTDETARLGLLSSNPELRRMGGNTGMTFGYLTNGGMLSHNYDAAKGVSQLSFKTAKEVEKSYGKLVALSARDSSETEELIKIRNLENQAMRVDFGKQDGEESKLIHKAMAHLRDGTEITGYDPKTGFSIKTLDNSSGRIVNNTIFKKLYGDGTHAPIQEIHPLVLAKYLDNLPKADFQNISTEHLQQSYQHILGQATAERKNLHEFVEKVFKSTQSGEVFDLNYSNRQGDEALMYTAKLADKTGDTKETLDVLRRSEEMFNRKEHSSILERAISTALKDPAGFMDPSQGDSSLREHIRANIKGQRGISQSHERFQEGVVSDLIMEVGYNQVMKDTRAKTDDELRLKILKDFTHLVEPFATHNAATIDLSKSELKKYYKRIGIIDKKGFAHTQEIMDLMGEMGIHARGPSYDIELNRKKIGMLSSAFLHLDDIDKIGADKEESQKLLKIMAQHLDESDTFAGTDRLKRESVNRLKALSDHFETTESLISTFKKRSFIPNPPSINPLSDPKFYVARTIAPSLSDVINDPFGTVQNIIDNVFSSKNAKGFVNGVLDPNAPLTVGAARLQSALQLPNKVASHIGMGLNSNDRTTLLRSTVGFLGKRVLPVVAGYEAYKNFNANRHQMHAHGLDDEFGDDIADANLIGSRIKDATGIIKVEKALVGNFQGLNKYFTPRTHKEYLDYLNYGEQDVKSGRLRLIGNRTEITGGKSSYFQPNFFSRWTSHWTEASNVDLSNPAHSFLPSILHPLAPINLLRDVSWWKNKHAEDRPYQVNRFGLVDNPGKNTLAVNSVGAYGAVSVATLGGGYSPVQAGGGVPSMSQAQWIKGAPVNPASVMGVGAGGFLLDDKGNFIPGATGVMSSGSGFGKITKGSELPGENIHVNIQKNLSPFWDVQKAAFISPTTYLEHARHQMGLIGSFAQQLGKLAPIGELPFEKQNVRAAHSFGRSLYSGELGELGGSYWELMKKFVPDPLQEDAYSPYKNNMPTWLPEEFKSGDPYTKVRGPGELQLPGEAYLKTHKWIQPYRVRGSQIGGTEQEIIEHWLNPLEGIKDQRNQDIVDFGSRVHLEVQRQLKQQGLLVSAETSILDKQNNISGTIDAIVKGPNGLEILDFKTQGGKKWGEDPKKYHEQLNTYMHITGIHQANLIYINRDDPNQMRKVSFGYDDQMWKETLAKVNAARDRVHQMEKNGKISPFETYDVVARLDILAHVAPNSEEFRETLKAATEGGLGGFEKQRVEASVRIANKLTGGEFYNRKYRDDYETRNLQVKAINDNGTILTNMGNIKFAGVKFDHQAFIYEDASDVLAKFGIHVGSNIRVVGIKGGFNSETMHDVTTDAVILKGLHNVNRELLHTRYGNADQDDNNPLAMNTIHPGGGGLAGRAWEDFTHGDWMLQNKFMRTRTALEEFKRGQVYGTNRSSWDDITHNFVVPTFNSLTAKNPITAAAMGGIIASLFFRSNTDTSEISHMKGKAAILGGAIAGAAALTRSVLEKMNSGTWVPDSLNKQNEMDTYWDTMKFVKYQAIAERAKIMAARKENTDINEIESGDQRSETALGPWGTMAVNAEKKAMQTMYAFNSASDSLQKALSVIPSRIRNISKSIIETGSLKDKQQYYNLLSDSERRVLGKFLNVDQRSLPKRPSLRKYFANHFLPGANWNGWNANVDFNDLKVRDEVDEGTHIDQPTRENYEKARSYTRGVMVPNTNSPTMANIKSRLHKIIGSSGFEGIDMTVDFKPSDRTMVNVNMDLQHDRTDDVQSYINNNM